MQLPYMKIPVINQIITERYPFISPKILPKPSKIVWLFTALLMENCFALISPWLAGQFSRSLLQEGPGPITMLGYKQILLIWIFVICCQGLITFYSRLLSGTESQQIIKKMRVRLYDRLQSLPIGYFQIRKHGEVLSLFSHDIVVISTFISTTLIGFVPHLLTAFGAIFCIFYINVFIGCLAFLLIPIFIVITRLLGRSISPITKKLMHQHGETFAIAEENLATLPAIKTFSQEDNQLERFRISNNQLFQSTIDYIRAQGKIGPTVTTLSSVIILLTLLLVSDQIIDGILSTSDVVSLLLYGLLLTRPLSSLADGYGQTKRALSAATRLSEVFSEEIETNTVGSVLPTIKGEIVFKDVSFEYPGRPPLFQKFNCNIQARETIAITGENGAGKSSIVHLLLRLFDPTSGMILIDNTDISSVTRSSLRSQIGIVQQNVVLRNSTIFENLRFGKQEATKEEILKAADAADALDFITKLPNGFETIIGDQGVKLSGGQKQRLALARALLKNPAILILDEATAMFDPEGEIQFIKKNEQYLRSVTVIIITHRPATLQLADKIYELKGGELLRVM